MKGSSIIAEVGDIQHMAFAWTYLKGISIIEEYGYDVCTDWGAEFDLETMGVFCDIADYLSALTGIKYHYTDVDILVYESDTAVQQDVQYLKKWYKKHGRIMTKKDSDSIVQQYYEKYKYGPPNIDSAITSWNKIRKERPYNTKKWIYYAFQ